MTCVPIFVTFTHITSVCVSMEMTLWCPVLIAVCVCVCVQVTLRHGPGPRCWAEKTYTERRLLVLVCALSVALFFSLITVGIFYKESEWLRLLSLVQVNNPEKS